MDPGSHPELSADFPVVIIEEYILGPVSAMETETLDPNIFASTYASNSVITNNLCVCDDRGDTTPIFAPINPAPDTYINE